MKGSDKIRKETNKLPQTGQTQSPDIRRRAFAFAIQIVELCKILEEGRGVGRTLGWQLLRAGTSIGANVEEAQAAQSRADFINKNAIALKEARETDYWLHLLEAVNGVSGADLKKLREEASAMARIIGAIIVSAKKGSRSSVNPYP
jgi:four helix bundle protein